MKQHKNLICKRILSFVMIFCMMLPFAVSVLPLVASAVEAINEATTPTVSLAWDTNTVTVTDGVATPYMSLPFRLRSYTV